MIAQVVIENLSFLHNDNFACVDRVFAIVIGTIVDGRLAITKSVMAMVKDTRPDIILFHWRTRIPHLNSTVPVERMHS